MTCKKWAVIEQAEDGDVLISYMEEETIDDVFEYYQTMDSGSFVVLRREVFDNLNNNN